MRSHAILILTAMLAATAAEAASAFKQTTITSGGIYAPRTSPNHTTIYTGGGVLAPLTSQECKKLGGSVTTTSICKSGSVCQTTDESGLIHEVCIAK